MKILAFDTSNQPLSVALFDDDKLIGVRETDIAKNHSEQLLPLIDELMHAQNWQPSDLDRVIVSQGPGSYTGLRIAVTTAKTLAFTLGIELVGISSLALLAANVTDEDAIIVPLMDARNDNVYSGQYQWQAGQLVNIAPDRHTSISGLPMALPPNTQKVIYVGEWTSFETVLQAAVPNASFMQADANKPHASNALVVAHDAKVLTAVDDIHQFVPNYLRVTQAEADWQKAHPDARNQDYVEKI
ncbi:MAG: tRNA (adenosine(37)-N6)-threonylcarbamoyltransferase complex dimerization subunit type 1 TsaB [Lactobacillaceae bacterium]|nr:tRNA (adenosine(37)-N6)-threonylcarbamoyltransferase complex dimerization subunit type 1 TsaB [Lactobacillaceae bacterium]